MPCTLYTQHNPIAKPRSRLQTRTRLQNGYEASMDMANQIVYDCGLELPIAIPTLTFSSSPS